MSNTTAFLALAVLLAGLLAANLFVGSVPIAAPDVVDALTGRADGTAAFIVTETRLPQALTALMAGAALAVAGLLMQTVFANPLADPSILGLNAGAGLGVAVATLALGGSFAAGAGLSLSGFALTLVAAFAGAAGVLVLLMACAARMRSRLLLLIVGLMISYAVGALVSLLSFTADAAGLHSYVLWGLGSFGQATWGRLPLFALAVGVGLGVAALLVKPLNALLLGESYAANLGVRIRRTRCLLLGAAGLLAAAVTALCGPVAFVGLAVPHVARLLVRSADHRVLLPATLLCGADVALACHLVCRLPSDGGLLPLNAVTPLVGVPVVFYVILRHRHAAD